MNVILTIAVMSIMSGLAGAADFAGLQGMTAAGIPEASASPDPGGPDSFRPAGPKAEGEALIRAREITLRVLEGSVDLSAYYASLEVGCSYKSGLFWPGSKSCGSRTLPAELTADGRLLVPAIEAFDHPRGRYLDNFRASITVRPRNDSRACLFSLSMRGREDLKAYAAGELSYDVLLMSGAEPDLLIEGAPFAGSGYATALDGYLLVSLKDDATDAPGPMIVTPLSSVRSFDNRDLEHTREPLAGLRALTLPQAAFVERTGEGRKLTLAVTYSRGEAAAPLRWRARLPVEKSSQGLRKLPSVNLLPAAD